MTTTITRESLLTREAYSKIRKTSQPVMIATADCSAFTWAST